ncbi:hypothetical protein ACHAQJ_000811 [Trichoderma viride]
MYPKSLRPVGREPKLHKLWNDATSPLRVKILEAVSAATDWTAIDILRVGLNEEFHTTLLLSVKPDSLSWSRGHAIALRCKAILEEYDIHHVHCEIRESIVTFCGDTPTTTESTSGDFQLSSMPIAAPYEEIRADLSDCLGTRIAMKHADYLVGTKGLYLSLSSSSSTEDEPRIVALTCRHVAMDAKTQGVQEYRHQQSQPFKEVIQVDQPTYKKRLQTFDQQTKQYRSIADKYRDVNAASAAVYDQTVVEIMALTQIMKPYEAPSARVFGRLLYSPEFATASSEFGALWLRDWALIELLASHHQAPLSSLKNKVFVGSLTNVHSLLYNNTTGWKELPEPVGLMIMISDYTIELQKVVVPVEELFKPAHVAEYTDEPATPVAKYGATGGLTFGVGNTLKSVVRHTENLHGDVESISEEWAITAVNNATDRQAAFSKGGDSGSCVWDMEGRPAGIIMAGGGMNQVNDVTYAQPLERLLADIRAHGFEVSLV